MQFRALPANDREFDQRPRALRIRRTFSMAPTIDPSVQVTCPIFDQAGPRTFHRDGDKWTTLSAP